MTNREEAILGLKELRDWEGLPYCIEEPMQREGVVVITQEVIDMAIQALEQQPRWIPVTERLPELGEVVLIYDKVFGYLTARYSEVVDDYNERIPCFSTYYSISSDKWAILHPIKWMPFEPYNAESENKE